MEPTDPVVPQDLYTEEYYREHCMGAEEWDSDQLSPMYTGYATMAPVRAGDVVIDLGCGRGELLVAAVEAGASRAIGVEYADAAIALARATLARFDVTGRAELHHGDARAIPLGDGEADLVTLLDVVEHLAPKELHQALVEARRVLRPGGAVFIHTMPNRSIYELTYRAQRWLRPRRLRRWPADPRKPLEHSMHVNEMSVRRLRRTLRRAGFRRREVWLGDWIYTDFVPDEAARRTYHRFAAHQLTERLGKGDVWARAQT
jgi:ubiquinone/menaquinone biosynthesis C-methylase UbiE